MDTDAIFALLFAALFGLIAVLWRIVWSKLQKIDSGALAEFRAMDAQREKDWYEWRDTVNTRLNKHSDRYDAVSTHETRIDRLERKVFNGGTK